MNKLTYEELLVERDHYRAKVEAAKVQKAVAWMNSQGETSINEIQVEYWRIGGCEITPLYARPPIATGEVPAEVVHDKAYANGVIAGWNAGHNYCRDSLAKAAYESAEDWIKGVYIQNPPTPDDSILRHAHRLISEANAVLQSHPEPDVLCFHNTGEDSSEHYVTIESEEDAKVPDHSTGYDEAAKGWNMRAQTT